MTALKYDIRKDVSAALRQYQVLLGHIRTPAQTAKGVLMTKLNNNSLNSAEAPHINKDRSRGDRPFTIYLAGDLWTHKDLIGNALLSKYIKSVSRGRYVCVLPQDLEEPVHRTVDIRNVDLKHVMTCDLAIFNFDGSNLDAGTVVEFIYAKMIDIPSVILRTDFRAAGEGGQEQDPWNLMATHWPRTKVVKLHGMSEYQGAKTPGQLGKTIEKMYKKMAQTLVDNLDAVRQEAPLVSDPARMAAFYQWALECPGAGYDKHFADNEVESLLSEKKRKGRLAK